MFVRVDVSDGRTRLFRADGVTKRHGLVGMATRKALQKSKIDELKSYI
jgi:hypothetical protein